MFDEISFDNTNDTLDIDTNFNENVNDELVKKEDEPSLAVSLGVIAVTAVGTGVAIYSINKLAHKLFDSAIKAYERNAEKKEQKEDNE